MHIEDVEYFLLPLGERRVLAVPVDGAKQVSGLHDRGEDAARALGPLLTTALRTSGTTGATVFEMSPESERLLATARRDEVGSYFRGVLRNDSGQTSHQVQLREVKPAAGVSLFEQVAAAQLAVIQAQLEQIEDILNSLVLTTAHVVQHIEGQQRARVTSALRLIGEVHERTARAGVLAGTDWDRLTGTVEFELEVQLAAVGDELERRLQGADFTIHPKQAIKAMDQLDPKRMNDLVEIHRVLVGGLRRYSELLLIRKLDTGEFDEREAVEVQARLQALHERHARVLSRLEAIVASARQAKPRSNANRLFKDGIVGGTQNDRRDLAGIEQGVEIIAASVSQSRRPKTIEGARRALPAAVSA